MRERVVVSSIDGGREKGRNSGFCPAKYDLQPSTLKIIRGKKKRKDNSKTEQGMEEK